MSSPPADPHARAEPAFPGLSSIADAFRFVARGMPEVGAWAVYLPVVGVVLGALWVATDHVVEPVAGRVGASAAILLVSLALTRARPAMALSRVLATLATGADGRLAALESGGGVRHWVWLALLLSSEMAVLAALDRFRLVGLALAPVLASCAMVVLAVGSRAARVDGRRLKFAPAVGFREFGVASTASFAMVFLTTEFLGLLLILTTAAFTIGARVFLHRWIGGVNQTVMLAIGEAAQLAILALLVLIG